jgi:hypothetical protein
MLPKIRYEMLDLAQDHYNRLSSRTPNPWRQARGDKNLVGCSYKSIEVPWAVSKEAWEITSPQGALEFLLEDKYLVASAEQGFLELMLQGKLPPGKYQAITPCFRKEKETTNLVRPYFMKLELIDTADTTIDRMHTTIERCLDFFCEHVFCMKIKTDLCERDPLAVSRTYDIVTEEGIELGSYGVREHPKVGKWVYGTGCAEPRLSQALLEKKTGDHEIFPTLNK